MPNFGGGLQMNPYLGSMTSLGPSPMMLQQMFNMQNARNMHMANQAAQMQAMPQTRPNGMQRRTAEPRMQQPQQDLTSRFSYQPMMRTVAPSDQMTNQFMPSQEGMQEPKMHTMPIRSGRMLA